MANGYLCMFCEETEANHNFQKKLGFYCEGFDLTPKDEEASEAIEHTEACRQKHEFPDGAAECEGNCDHFMAFLRNKGVFDIQHDVWMVTNRGLVNIGD